jgi:hypothetical protein
MFTPIRRRGAQPNPGRRESRPYELRARIRPSHNGDAFESRNRKIE